MPFRYNSLTVHVFIIIAACVYNGMSPYFAVGEFKQTSAIQFCMTVTDTNVDGTIFNDTNNTAKK